MLRSFVLLLISFTLFIAFMFVYGVFLRNREPSLSELLIEKKIEKIRRPKIVIQRKNNTLDLYDGNSLIKKYKVDLGHSDFSLSVMQDSYVTTPKGEFSICKKSKSDKFYKKFMLNYPDSFHILQAEKFSIIGKEKALSLLKKLQYGCSLKFDKKIFGPKIYILGFGKANIILKNLPFFFNWTDGSIALANEDLNELEPYLKIGMKIVIE